ncbi:sigma-54-dependent transcriptional regulator [Saccharicrinis aurantiacus]|uniref:sigma-54-dependent transcriptional regulator n=1 Tax=Saccharicrinis aurantiacus TaxID=1849719 RepID=UPI00094F58A4|nr:sigma-54 dependent transcriptional regulator [Saccharicrinis aurantiacus]
MYKVLIIDDDITLCTMLNALLTKNGYEVHFTYEAKGVLKLVEQQFFDIILSDIRLPDADGMDLLKAFNKITPQSQVIMLTSYANYNTAVRSIKEGAFSYIPKPFSPSEVLSLIKEAIADKKVIEPVENKLKQNPNYIEGTSAAALQLAKHIQLVSPTQMSVLIIGKSGTGKEYIAKSIHKQSTRSEEAFIAVDCGSIPKELLASEFFGHVKGSFTGAYEDKKGYFELANKGTLFLDEVGNLPYDSQIQLLRVLQERQIKPVGASKWINVDVRLVAATNNDLKQSIKEGTFREDLYHRLNEFDFEVPALSQRREDIMQFANYFLYRSNNYLNKDIKGFTPEVVQAFEQYEWPGNLRELKNVIKRATLLATDSEITMNLLPADFRHLKPVDDFVLSNPDTEKETIIKALKASNNNKSKAARLLNVDRKTLYNKLKRFGIDL